MKLQSENLWKMQTVKINTPIRGGVEDTRLEAKAKDTKNKSKAKPKDSLPRTDPLEAKNRNARDQGPRTQAQVFSKEKKVFKNFFQTISRRGKQKRSLQIFREVSGIFSHNFENEQISTFVGTDANAHRTIWGSFHINPRGEDLLAYCVGADLNFCTTGNKPTFRTKTREEVLDLT